MTIEDALQIVERLADGVDPTTGEVLPEGHVLHERTCIRALSMVAAELGSKSRKQREPVAGRENAGQPWTADADSELTRLFGKGETVADLAGYFQRSKGAITSRLQRLNLITDGAD